MNPISPVIAAAKLLLRHADYHGGLGEVRPEDCEALEAAIKGFEAVPGTDPMAVLQRMRGAVARYEDDAELDAAKAAADAVLTGRSSLKPKMTVKVCKHCGSSDVRADAFAKWDVVAQDWVVEATFDKGATCDNCDGECRIVDRLLPLAIYQLADDRAEYGDRAGQFLVTTANFETELAGPFQTAEQAAAEIVRSVAPAAVYHGTSPESVFWMDSFEPRVLGSCEPFCQWVETANPGDWVLLTNGLTFVACIRAMKMICYGHPEAKPEDAIASMDRELATFGSAAEIVEIVAKRAQDRQPDCDGSDCDGADDGLNTRHYQSIEGDGS